MARQLGKRLFNLTARSQGSGLINLDNHLFKGIVTSAAGAAVHSRQAHSAARDNLMRFCRLIPELMALLSSVSQSAHTCAHCLSAKGPSCLQSRLSNHQALSRGKCLTRTCLAATRVSSISCADLRSLQERAVQESQESFCLLLAALRS